MKKLLMLVSFALFLLAPLAAQITVKSPNGGEKWVKGSMHNITWAAVNFSGDVDLVLKQNDKHIGTIARKLPAGQGAHPWAVGTLLDGKTAGLGRGYKVRVVKNFEGLYRPAGSSELADESDGAFSIENAYTAPIPDAWKINVTTPTEGQEFEYGREILEGNRYATVKCRWTSSKSGPFKFFLREEGNIKEKEMKAVSGPVNLGNNTYEAEFRLSRKANFTSPGLCYKIHVDAGGFFKGYSGKFKLKYKLHEVTLEPQIANIDRHHSEKNTAMGGAYISATPTDPIKIGWVRVGFRNNHVSSSINSYYIGYIYRARVSFDLSRFEGLRGTFKSALVSYEGREFIHKADMNLADCDVQVYILASPWPGGDFMAIPGSIIQNYPQGAAKNFDISDWCENWKRGTHPNHGMLFLGKNEKFDHDNLFGVSYYKIRLKVRFVED